MMASLNKTTKTKDREEDFRDYEERDIGEGWPYADGEPVKKRNEAYGANSDELDPTNAEIATATFIESGGGPSPFPEEEMGTINDDGIEEEIANKLSESGRWDDTQLTVTVHKGIADISGQVETEQERQLINQVVLRTAGIRDVNNRLTLSGVDSHTPRDADG
jgi:hypothetical protein